MIAANSNIDINNLEELPIDFFEGFRTSNDSYDIVTVGDAWFNYPQKLKDVKDYLSLSYKTFHIDITNTYLIGSLMSQLSDKLNHIPHSTKLIILSAGFYDFIQLFPLENSKNASSSTDSEIATVLQESFHKLNNIGIPIIIHGYDYFIPGSKNTDWLSTTLSNRKLEKNQFEECKKIVDAFNETLLNQVSLKFSNFYYLDLRGTLSESDWYDELHPNDEGSRKLSEKFKEKIEDVLNPVKRPPQDLLKKKILWVDDNPIDNIILSDLLKKHNISITDTLDTDTAIKYLQENKYDLIITDIGRGKEREAGIDLLNQVKSLDISTPLVFYTTKANVKKYKKQVLDLKAFAIKTGSADQMAQYFLDLLDNLDSKNKVSFNNKWILVAGTGVEPLTALEKEMAIVLGKQLAYSGFGLITGGWPGVDIEICKSFSYSLKEKNENPNDRLIQVIEADLSTDFSQYGEIVFALDFSNWNEIALRKAYTMVMIGGKGGAFTTFEAAQKMSTPVISIPITGGDAERAYNFMQNSKQGSIFQNSISATVSDPKIIAEQIIRNLEDLELNEKKPVSDDEFKEIVENLYKSIEIKEPDDLQKYRWGSNAKNNGKIVSAMVENSMIPSFYNVKITITDSSKTNEKAALFLHNTFKEEIRFLTFTNGVATCELTMVYESFTAGAYLEDGTPLELDLNDLSGFPSGFYHLDISEYFKKVVLGIYQSKKTIVKDDSQKGKWGGLKESKDLMLSAEVTEGLIPKKFTVKLIISSSDLLKPFIGDVAFFVDSTFSKEIMYKKAKDGEAILTLTAYEAFTVGVYTQSGVMLELDLQQEEGFPENFYYEDSSKSDNFKNGLNSQKK